MHVKEKEAAKFECEFSITDVNVVWKVKDEEIEASPKYAIVADGKHHTLVISKTKPEDEGPVSCSFNDITTEARLTVRGKASCLPFLTSV